MPDCMQTYRGLTNPFTFGDDVAVRVGPTNEKGRTQDQPLRGQPLYYIDARSVMERLDQVCGFDGWQCTYTPGVGGSIICNIGLLLQGDWVWKADGAGASDMEAEKGALSDAFKRAAVRWGVGRYLYDLHAPWIVLEKRGNTAVIPENARPGLQKIHDDFAERTGWGPPEGITAYRLLLREVEALAPASVAQYLADNADLIGRFPVLMHKHFMKAVQKTQEAKK